MTNTALTNSNYVALVETLNLWWTREMEDRINRDGWNAYLVTFTFRHLPQSSLVRLKLMNNAVSRFYSTLITRVVRNPHSPYQFHNLPKMVAAPDYPVFKHEKISLTEAKINDGLHMHGILGMPLKSRLKEGIESHIDRKHHAYIQDPLRKIHFEYIEGNMADVVDYASKSVKRGRCSWEDLLFFPKSHSEM